MDLTDRADQDKGIKWWEELTASGGEGMVVKPLEFVAKGRKGLVQPAVKVRGREYLRIIYGPEYTLPENLLRLKSRGLGAKRSLALREFALGLEALERFVHQEPLRRAHECVFGVLALGERTSRSETVVYLGMASGHPRVLGILAQHVRLPPRSRGKVVRLFWLNHC